MMAIAPNGQVCNGIGAPRPARENNSRCRHYDGDGRPLNIFQRRNFTVAAAINPPVLPREIIASPLPCLISPWREPSNSLSFCEDIERLVFHREHFGGVDDMDARVVEMGWS